MPSSFTKVAMVVALYAATTGVAGPLSHHVLGSRTCLTQDDAEKLAAAEADLIGAFAVDKAEKLLTDDFHETSDSINALSGRPLGSVTFPTKADFISEQAPLPSIPLVIQDISAVTCDTVVFRWTQTFGQGIARPVAGITVLVASQNQNDDEWKIKALFTEFNSLVYLENTGGNCSLPPPPGQ